ncbi:pilus assembly protein [Nocardiopsis sp. HNM0947]|uniref:Pilus assembly protein n=1 Tax=Nocardiopsis coralli TaxID=2772213 RepID=A0ABR9PDC9_9ACTN|nr:TadE family type IV pilus minor pilin [Nocardiopsis coralli]MBE3001845.1 pilus assembly protein [Nocardiopsis coralli]
METAMVLPSLLLLLALCLGVVLAASAQLACSDAARVGARALARGESDDRARELALSAAPEGADIDLEGGSDMSRVTVRAELTVGSVVAVPVQLVGTAAVPVEPGPAEVGG